jgi:hypothetical protein
MRVNDTNKSVDIEPRDMNFILGSYVRSYQFYMKNQDPEEIIVPMVESIPHPLDKTRTIPIRYVPPMSPEAIDIIHDGAGIPESAEDEAKADAAEKMVHDAAVASGAVSDEEVKPSWPANKESDLEDKAQALEDEASDIRLEEETASHEPTFNVGSDQPDPDRQPNQPERPAEGHPDDMSSRQGDVDTRRVAKDLASGSGDVDDQPSKPYEKDITRDPETGEPIVESEDTPDDTD